MSKNPRTPPKKGAIAVEIGKRREEIFVRAWNRLRGNPNKPPWFSSARKATWVEDHHDHIDAYLVRVDQYEIPIQIKGTLRAAKKHGRKWNAVENNVVVVIIREYDTDEMIIWSTLKAIENLKLQQDDQLKLLEISKADNDPVPTPLEVYLGIDIA